MGPVPRPLRPGPGVNDADPENFRPLPIAPLLSIIVGKGGRMAKVSWNRTWSEKMRGRKKKKTGKNRLTKKKK